MNVTELLLQTDIPKPQTKQFRQRRLSEAAGKDVLFTLQQIGFSRTAEIKRMHQDSEEMEVHILLAGLVEPDFKSRELQEKYKSPTPAELVKALLLPGEITDLSREVEKLSGYRVSTLEEVKKK